MGDVYEGEHDKIQTRVAVKVLHAAVSRDSDHVERFFNEAKIVGKIHHAGIVKIFDVGFFQDRAYLIMELLEGEPLSRRIEREALPWHTAATVGAQIANVLDATHGAGVVHRDLKPDNVFLVPDHQIGERVKILDFGISKLSGTMAGNSPRTVGTMGTPGYMAPEQWGDSATVDWRADAYSLGCVLFEMACGRPPFEVQTIADACAKHLHQTPPLASSIVPEIPPVFDELIARLLAKEPSDRAVAMSQIVLELEAIAAGLDVAAMPARRAPRRLRSEPRFTPVSPKATVTTLGGSAAELQPSRARKPAMIGLVVGVAAIAVVIVVMTRGHGDEPAKLPELPKAATSSRAPVVVTLPTPAPVVVAPAPTPTPEVSPPPVAHVVGVTHSHPVKTTKSTTVVPPPAVVAPPPPAVGSAAPPIGGRI